MSTMSNLATEVDVAIEYIKTNYPKIKTVEVIPFPNMPFMIEVILKGYEPDGTAIGQSAALDLIEDDLLPAIEKMIQARGLFV